MHWARKILFPFSILYGGIIFLRNKLYDYKIFKSHSFEIPILCVGNLSVGGTGKSPMVEYLISFLKKDYKVAVLSRGYKRTSSGFKLLQGNEKAAEVGDEPLQFKTKFPEISVAVDEKRSRGIEQLLELNNKPEIILLDDAFQHRKVSAGFNILLTSYSKLYSEDFMLPFGNLREPKTGAKRAQVVVVTKCPADIKNEEKQKVAEKLAISRAQELFFTTVNYNERVYNKTTSTELKAFQNNEFTLVTGIANPQALVGFLKARKLEFEHLKYPDHHNFTPSEIKHINEKKLILTTEKDFMRLKNVVSEEKLFYLPIKTAFLEGKEKFEQTIKTFLATNARIKDNAEK